MRLDKYISNHSQLSRKEVRQAIKAKRIMVNDVYANKADMAINVDLDQISLDGELLKYQKYTYILLNKPAGYVSANHDLLFPTVFDLITDYTKGLVCVGRLDKDTEGLLLITNDGVLAHRLLAPKHHVSKKYYVEIVKPLSENDISLLTSGTIELDGKKIKPASVEILSETSLYLTISEGKFHQVKRMLMKCDNEVTFLKRVAMGKLVLPSSLKLGEYCYINKNELI